MSDSNQFCRICGGGPGNFGVCLCGMKAYNAPTWPYVLAFAKRMEARLSENRRKVDRDGWLKLDVTELGTLLEQEIKELHEATAQRDVKAIAEECADVANVAMMIDDWFYHLDINPIWSRRIRKKRKVQRKAQ